MWYLIPLFATSYFVIKYRWFLLQKILTLWQEKIPEAEHVSGSVYKISYLFKGQPFHLYFPVLESKGLPKEVYTQDGSEYISLTQQPGVPYLIRPHNLGLHKNVICVQGEEHRIFGVDEEISIDEEFI